MSFFIALEGEAKTAFNQWFSDDNEALDDLIYELKAWYEEQRESAVARARIVSIAVKVLKNGGYK